jgi:hypothetical protein
MSNETTTTTQVDWEKVRQLHHSDDQYLINLEKNTIRDPNTGRILRSPIGSDWDPKLDPDKQTKVWFSNERVLSKYETAKNNEPTYIVQEFITVIPPRLNAEGKPTTKDYTTIHTIATPFYQWRFPNEYKAFKEGKQKVVGKTTLPQWPPIMAHADVIEEMALIGIKTVEDLATTSEYYGKSHVKNFEVWKQKAKEYFAEKNKPQEVLAVENKLAEQQKKHDDEIKALTEQVNALIKQLSGTESEGREKGPDGKFVKRKSE